MPQKDGQAHKGKLFLKKKDRDFASLSSFLRFLGQKTAL